MLRLRRALLASVAMGGEAAYYQRVLATAPIAYWPLWETTGTQAEDIAGSGWHGTYTDVTPGGPGIGDGFNAAWFPGENNRMRVVNAAFNAAFSGSEGTLMAWAKVANAAVWTDAANRRVFRVSADNSNYVQMMKADSTNRFALSYRSGGAAEKLRVFDYAPTDWTQLAITWSHSAGASGEVRCYYAGLQLEEAFTDLTAWAGAPSLVIAGAWSDGTTPWYGWLAHCAVWTRALTPAELRRLSYVQANVASGDRAILYYRAARAAAPLVTPTYDGSGEAVHPDVYDAGEGNT